jgi:hypothetical protein
MNYQSDARGELCSLLLGASGFQAATATKSLPLREQGAAELNPLRISNAAGRGFEFDSGQRWLEVLSLAEWFGWEGSQPRAGGWVGAHDAAHLAKSLAMATNFFAAADPDTAGALKSILGVITGAGGFQVGL